MYHQLITVGYTDKMMMACLLQDVDKQNSNYFMILIKLSDAFVFSQPFSLYIYCVCVQMKGICRGNGLESARQSGKAGQKEGMDWGGGYNLGCVCVLSILSSPG